MESLKFERRKVENKRVYDSLSLSLSLLFPFFFHLRLDPNDDDVVNWISRHKGQIKSRGGKLHPIRFIIKNSASIEQGGRL